MTSLQKSHLKTPASECHLYRNHIRKQNHYQQSKTHILHMHYTINYLNCELTGDSFECYSNTRYKDSGYIVAATSQSIFNDIAVNLIDTFFR